MASKGWGWFAGVACVVAGCSGKVLDNHGARAGGAGTASSAERDDGAPAGGAAGAAGASSSPADAGAAGIDQQAGGAPSCEGTLAQVAKLWGFSCPQELCAGRLLASDCSALPGGALKTGARSCFDDQTLSFEISPTRRKVCYYGSEENDGVSLLVGATVWDDEASFCDGTSVQISGGQTEPKFAGVCPDADPITLCDLAHPEQNLADNGTPPHACYNRFSHSCEVCCPKTAPDCSDKPQNYPGYSCTPDDPGNASYCACDCQGGDWICAC